MKFRRDSSSSELPLLQMSQAGTVRNCPTVPLKNPLGGTCSAVVAERIPQITHIELLGGCIGLLFFRARLGASAVPRFQSFLLVQPLEPTPEWSTLWACRAVRIFRQALQNPPNKTVVCLTTRFYPEPTPTRLDIQHRQHSCPC